MSHAVVFDAEDRAQDSHSLSHSRINRYLTCPEQYRLHYIERLRPRFTSAGMAFGQVLHQALADFFRDACDPIQSFEETWNTLAELDLNYAKRDSWAKLRGSGVALLGKFMEEAVPRITNVVAVEQAFELQSTTLEEPIIGFLDLVADFDGRRTVVDFKTATSSYGDHDIVLSDQLTAYRLAQPDAEQLAFCVLVRTKEPRIEWHVTERTPDQLTAYLAKVGEVAQDITQGRFYRRSGFWCSWCDFLPVCLGDSFKAEQTLIQLR